MNCIPNDLLLIVAQKSHIAWFNKWKVNHFKKVFYPRCFEIPKNMLKPFFPEPVYIDLADSPQSDFNTLIIQVAGHMWLIKNMKSGTFYWGMPPSVVTQLETDLTKLV